METHQQIIGWGMFFSAYAVAAFTAWSWLARRHIQLLAAGKPPSFRRDIVTLITASALGALPPLAFLTSDSWRASQSVTALIAFLSAWLLFAAPGAIRSRRIMQAGGVDPDAA